jgi:hypothetical protein
MLPGVWEISTYAVIQSPKMIMKVMRKRPYTCADFFLVRSCGYQNKLIFGEMKPITSNRAQAIIKRNKIFSNCTGSSFVDGSHG